MSLFLGGRIPHYLRTLLALRFYATGSFQIVVSDMYGVHQSSVSRCVSEVSKILTKLLPRYIRMNPEEFDEISKRFRSYAKFPKVIGCIDCTHVYVKSPGGENPELFRDRKGRFSLNIQAVCDDKLKLTNLVARWRGSTHDSRIFQNSTLYSQFERNEKYKGYHLLGDSGYACSNAILTPFREPATEAQERYNTSQIKTRGHIERCFGVLKRRFPCMKQELETKLKNTLYIITAVGMLTIIY